MSRINRMLNELTESGHSDASVRRPISPSWSTTKQSLTLAHVFVLLVFVALALGLGWMLGNNNSFTRNPIKNNANNNVDPVAYNNGYNAGLANARMANATTPFNAGSQTTQVLYNPQTGQYVTIPIVSVGNTTGHNSSAVGRASKTNEATGNTSQLHGNATTESGDQITPTTTTSTTQGQSPDVLDDVLGLQPLAATQTAGANKTNNRASVTSVNLSNKQMADLEYKKGLAAIDDSNVPSAIEHLQEALRYNPRYDDATKRLATLLYASGQTGDAVSILQRSITANPNNIQLKLTLAKLLENDNKPQAALNVLSVVPKQFNSEYIAMRGMLAQQLQQDMTAYESYKQLISKESFDGRWWLGLAISADRLNYRDEALTAYNKALTVGQISTGSQAFVKKRIKTLSSNESAGVAGKGGK